MEWVRQPLHDSIINVCWRSLERALKNDCRQSATLMQQNQDSVGEGGGVGEEQTDKLADGDRRCRCHRVEPWTYVL